MAKLYLIRHGQSVANRERRFTLEDDEPLTEEGIEQARATAVRLAELARPIALYSSPLARALATAREIGARLGLEPSLVPELREQGFGQLRGAPYEHYYDIHAAGTERTVDHWRRRPPQGESLDEVAGRVGPALDRLAQLHLGREVVVVSHGGVMAALRAHVRRHFELPPESTPNAGGYRVEALLEGELVRYRGPFDLFETGTETGTGPRAQRSERR